MTALTAATVYDLALGTGLAAEAAVTMTVVSFFESGWDPNNVGDQTLSPYGSRGLWQIFTGVHTPQEVLGHGGDAWTDALIAELEVPANNAHAMHVVYLEQGFKAWSTYNNLSGTSEWATKTAEVQAAIKPAPTPTPDPSSARDYLDKRGNVQPGVTQALLKAEASKSYPTGMCLQWTREQWGIGPDEPNAISAWRAVPVGKRHSYYTPPAGVPVFWSGGSRGLGHVALSLGGGKVRSLDIGGAGTVTTVDLAEIHVKWGLAYLGWTETLNGATVYKEGN